MSELQAPDDTKKCRGCDEVKPITQYYVHGMMADGHLNYCKRCVKDRVRKHHHKKMKDPEWREKERARGREKWKRLHHRWDDSNKTDRSAHKEVRNAIKRGDLVPPNQCEDCGHDFSEFRLEAHHEDYSKPLDVDWLCALCHGKRHRKY